LRSRDRRLDLRAANRPQISLPCPSAPLQSMAAAASRRFAPRSRRGYTSASTSGPTPTFAGPDRRRRSTYPSLRRPPRRKAFRSAGTRSRSEPPESGRTSCRVVRRAPSLALRDDGCAGANNSDTSHGVQCLSTKSASRIVTPTCLTGAIRSQGFSPSQRLHPLETSWLCFTPHPSPGFRASRAFSTQPAAAPLGAQCSLAVQVSKSSEPKSGAITRNCGFRAFIRLSIRHPPDRSPTGRCSPGLSPLRGLPDTTAGPKSSPHALRLRRGLLCTAGLRWATPQGVYSRAWRRLGEPPQPP
jgi:hypothetical protein